MAEENFTDDDYKKLFEYQISSDSKEKKEQEREDKDESYKMTDF
jgi:hypothetical protein